MNIDLTKVLIREMQYEGKVDIPKSFYQNTSIIDLPSVSLKFNIYRDYNQDDHLLMDATGSFILEDAYTLEKVNYPFKVHFEDKIAEESEFLRVFLTNSKNTLDIISILWENIVLEIPISFTTSNNLPIKGKDKEWEVVGPEKKIDPRLAPLMELLDKEKE